jgi:hypothetical protein
MRPDPMAFKIFRNELFTVDRGVTVCVVVSWLTGLAVWSHHPASGFGSFCVTWRYFIAEPEQVGVPVVWTTAIHPLDAPFGIVATISLSDHDRAERVM